ncbi:MAG: hypothetical protein Fur0024_5370 [Patescibacteria group bacterium]
MFKIYASSFIDAVPDPMSGKGLLSIIGDLIQTSIVIAGLISVVYIIIAGYNYIESNGESGKIDRAKKGMQSAIYGFVYVLVAYAIKNTVEYILF